MLPSKRSRAALGSALLLLLSSSNPTPTLSSNANFADSQHAKCPGGLKCRHGGSCAAGDKDHSLDHPSVLASDLPWLEELNVNGQHCVGCHDGWGGVDCGRRYQSCDANDPLAPTCFNGGACFKMGIGASTGKYEYLCDCTRAEHENGAKYAGKFCQHVQEEQCDMEMFCTNGGKCRSMADLDGIHEHFVCECPSHRAGTHCEFLQEEGFSFHRCSLDCEHGTCAKGFKSYDELIGTGPFPAALAFDIISSSGEHCVCPDGWTGLQCEIPVRRCGPRKYCYNGSTCAYDDSGEPLCDCNSAHTDGVSYAGSSCEQESTSRCTPGLDQDEKDSFCTNHGRCIEDPETRHEGCVCDEGWTGDLCDIEAVVEPLVCDLDCKNGGSCRFGVKGYKDAIDELNLPVHAKKQQDGMHCSCPHGFTGLKCEVDMNHCGESGSEHFCLNGVSCAPDALKETFDGVLGLKKFSCQCDEHAKHDEISQMLAGRFCEYAVTEFCTDDEEKHTHSFCTNGGKCKKYNDRHDTKHHGCCCPDGYEGEYCQFPDGTLDLAETPVTWSPLGECKHVKKSSQNVFPVSPNANGEWEHITINPKYQVPSKDEKKEAEPAAVESVEPQAPPKRSHAAGIASGVLFVALLAGAIAGVVLHRRSEGGGSQSFESDWWRGHTQTSEWWKGDSPIEQDTNIAPAAVPARISRTWSYGPDEGDDDGDARWDDEGSLHDVVI